MFVYFRFVNGAHVVGCDGAGLAATTNYFATTTGVSVIIAEKKEVTGHRQLCT